jgi:hypothetical protein
MKGADEVATGRRAQSALDGRRFAAIFTGGMK